MIESIGVHLTSLCEDILPFYLSEGEHEGFPYAVYSQTVQEWRDKDGVYQITSESTIDVYSDDFDAAQTAASAIRAALDGEPDGEYILRHRTTTKSCVDGVWDIELVYFVKQKKIN